MTQQIGKLVEANVNAAKASGWIAGILHSLQQKSNALQDYGMHMIRRLLESGKGVAQITWSQVLPTAVPMVANQAQVFTQTMDYYLSDAGKVYLPELHRLAKLNTPEAGEKLLHYCMEGIRMNGTFGLYRKATKSQRIEDKGRQVPLKAGDRAFVSFVGAAKDADVFPEPETIRLDQPLESYIHYGVGSHACLGRDVSCVAIPAMVKTLCRLRNLRRAPGPQGELKKIPRPGGIYVYMREDYSSYFPFPTTMKVRYDGEPE